ncbi:VCBS repeat-containing protein [Actinomadura sp. 7K507]|uniref:FG-GAP repeat domain-containing protein n=1 Tax=Actinomadura sp. 7K507 TaxID=2530365 RepID=UPI001050252C|nr:VCBS repeat-containing protein [Actinomadura sp. 7K507]TDC83028.1 VCBS repeat-containing protein [Actinomadura sp. 7K507]
MRIRPLLAMAAALTVPIGATTAVAVVWSGDDTGNSSQDGTTGRAPSFTQIMNSLPPGAAPSPARKSAVPDDFNGDGYRDIAGRGPDRTGGDLITVIYGGPKGADPARRQVIAAPGGGPSVLTERRTRSADFDRDGYADLLTLYFNHTTPSKNTTAIVYGGPRGLTSRTAALPKATGSLAIGDFDGNGVPDLASTTEVPGDRHTYDPRNVVVYANPGADPGKAVLSDTERGDYSVGRSLMTGDFNGDRRTDLLLVASNHLDGLISDSWLELRPGTAEGLGPTNHLPDEQAEGISASYSAAGDINGDGRTDLVTTVAPETELKGTLAVQLATASGFGKPRTYKNASLGISDSLAALRVGDVNADGRADVILGSYVADDRSGDRVSGSVSVLYGTRTGLDTKSLRTYSHGFRTIPDRSQAPGQFGEELSLTDSDRNGKIELVVGAPNRDGKEGRLYIVTDPAEDLTAKGMRRFTPADLGIAGRKVELGRALLG